MSSLAERRRNNVRAGIFVTVALVLGVAVTIVLTDVVETFSRRTHVYTVTFDVSTGVSNMKPGADVRVGGVRMGEVTDIQPQVSSGQAFRSIAVDFELDERVTLYADAHIVVATPVIGADAWLDIPNVGDPAAGRPAANQLQGTPSVGMLTMLLGTENAGKANEMVENARVFSSFLGAVPDEYETSVRPTLENLKSASADIEDLTSDVRTSRWPQWADAVSEVMTWATTVTGRLDETVAEGHGLLSDARAVVEENREGVRQIVGNVEDATGRINNETIDKVHALLDRGQDGLDHAVAALEELRIDYAGWATNIGEALANANLASQQLKLTTIETRRSPWKLLYRPTADELEHELLYEATRSFAVAASDLKAAAQSVQRVLDTHGPALQDDQPAYQRLETSLLNSLERYEKAQQQLLDILVADRPARQ